MSHYWEGFRCAVCNGPFTRKQWEDRHNGDNGEEYHEGCCPDCNAEPVRPKGCQSTTHDHTLCYGVLWACERCHMLVCCADGQDDGETVCDACWAELHPEEGE